MLHLIGTFAGLDVENVPASASYDAFTSKTVRVMDASGNTHYARCSRDFVDSDLPERGQSITLAVWPRPYVKKADNSLGCSFTTYRVVTAALV
jgi:hypothetical protein